MVLTSPRKNGDLRRLRIDDGMSVNRDRTQHDRDNRDAARKAPGAVLTPHRNSDAAIKRAVTDRAATVNSHRSNCSPAAVRSTFPQSSTFVCIGHSFFCARIVPKSRSSAPAKTAQQQVDAHPGIDPAKKENAQA